MLTRLFIQNLATVQKQIVDFSEGFSVLTGETGAGKSIIIRSINLILGEKISKDLIRASEEFLSVEAVFDISDNLPVRQILKDLDIEFDHELSIRRKTYRNGKGSIYINDYTSKLIQLSQLGKYLIDLHGQHAQQILLQPGSHIDFLDQFAGQKESVVSYGALYHELVQKKKRRSELERSSAERAQQQSFLKFQIDEITNAGFTEAEEKELNEEYQRLTHAEQILDTLSPIADWHNGQNAILVEINNELRRLKELATIAPDLGKFAEEIQSGLITLEEASADVQQYVSRFEVNPGRLEAVNERLALLDTLKRKYGQSLQDILQYQEDKEKELAELDRIDEGYEELDHEIAELTARTTDLANQLSERRKEIKPEFERLVLGNLRELGMEKCEFSIDVKDLLPEDDGTPRYNQKGRDRVEFLIATNPGNPLKALSKIASGGEVSRIMLAIKTSLTEDVINGTMIFDEVDAGISGRVAEIVGDKLSTLGKRRQVICITHSPQIAAKAACHFRVEKEIANDASTTVVTPLDDEARVDEIAKFLGGDTVSQKTRSLARDMLSQ